VSEPFDPDAFLAKEDAPFDPDAFLASPVDDLPPVEQPGPSPKERVLGSIASFASGSPLFGLVSRASDSLTGQNSQKSAARATEQFSPKIPKSVPLVGGAPVLPLVGGMVATAPAGAASIAPKAGAALLGARGAMAARVGLQGGIGGVTAADRGGDAGDVALGTGLGLAGGALGEGVGVALSKLSPAARQWLREFAKSQAGKAILGGGNITNKLKSNGVSPAQFDDIAGEVLDSGLLGYGPIPRNAQGINQAVDSRLAAAGSEIGRVRELADDMVFRGAPGSNPAEVTQAYGRGAEMLAAKTGLGDHLDNLAPVINQGEVFTRQAAVTPKGGSFDALWGQTSRMANNAYKPGDALGEALAKRELSRAAVARAREQIARQMEGVVGPDEMAQHAAAMKDYAAMSKVSGFTEDAAARAAARNTVGLGDTQLAQTLGLTGSGAAAALPFISLVRSRANSGLAMGANQMSRATPMAAGAVGAVNRLATPAYGRTVKDALDPDEAEGVDAFLSNSP
jgi:hypothetical protein